jgi:two-component system, cell cycle sensor histidine kinase and response regulator CckA
MPPTLSQPITSFRNPTAALQPDPERCDLGEARCITVLLIEDSDLDALLLQNAFQAATSAERGDRFVCQWAQTVAQARELIARQHFDLVIVDLFLPDSQGLETLSAIRAAAKASALIVVTAANDRRSATEALRLGAQDYLVKGEFTFPSLERAVRYALDRKTFAEERLRDQSEREQLQEQLRQAQRMEALGRLAGGVAHDFNNILTVILGHAAMLQGGLLLDTSERDESLREIQTAGERASRLTGQLLAFSRQQPATPKVLSLNSAIRDMEKTLTRLIGEDIEVGALLSADVPNVRIDPGHVEQILMNLAVNARDAMPDGGVLTIRTVRIEVGAEMRRLRPYVNAGTYVQLSVNDTGIGMDDAVRARIFEPFFTTKEQGRGTGLGLSTVYGIVKQADGYIWCTSVRNIGTRFDILLPATDAPEEHFLYVSGEHSMAAGEGILVVEDDPSLRAIVLRTLRGAGYSAIEAVNGEEALRIAQTQAAIDVLLTDMVMPGIKGRELAERIAAIRPGIRVVYMSGYTDDKVVHRGALPKNHQFLQKPFRGADLLRVVGAALAAKS